MTSLSRGLIELFDFFQHSFLTSPYRKCLLGPSLAGLWASRTPLSIHSRMAMSNTHTHTHTTDEVYGCCKPQIAKFMGPTWGPPGSCRPQMCPMLAPWTLLSGLLWCNQHVNTESEESRGYERSRPIWITSLNHQTGTTGRYLSLCLALQPKVTRISNSILGYSGWGSSWISVLDTQMLYSNVDKSLYVCIQNKQRQGGLGKSTSSLGNG